MPDSKEMTEILASSIVNDVSQEEKTAEKKIINDVFKGHEVYILHFRRGNRAPMSKIFMFNGNLHQAIERAKRHCAIFDYKFCGCFPYIVDLAEQEKQHEDNLGMNNL